MSENKKYKSDIEIAREAKLQNILEIAKKKLNIEEKFLKIFQLLWVFINIFFDNIKVNLIHFPKN